MEVVIRRDYEAVCDEAARLIAEALKARPSMVLGLATGKTPLGVYDRLVRAKLDWSRARFFNLDEFYGVEPEAEFSFNSYLRRYFLNRINAREKNIHLLGKCTGPEYEEQIRKAGGIDLQLLGIGMNGHIGFNEPGSSFLSRTRLKTLSEQTRRDHAGAFGGLRKVPPFSMTMGIGTILEARRLLVLACGERKSKIVRAALEGPVTCMVPASAVQMHPDAVILLDAAAAKRLKLRRYWEFLARNKWRAEIF